jgi:peptide/nickel transport system permease protein
MLIKKLKISYIILFIWILLIIFRFKLIINGFKLLFEYLSLLFTHLQTALNILDFGLIDVFIGLILLIAVPAFIIVYRSKAWLQLKLSVPGIVIILLSFSFLFAPYITNWNPDFQKNISVTRLLHPFTNVKVLHLNNKIKSGGNNLGGFFQLKDKVVKRSFDESIIFVDSLSAHLSPVDSEWSQTTARHYLAFGKSAIYFFQNGIRSEIMPDKIQFENGKPLITRKIFWLGTDEFGRDIFSRIIYGARISLLVGLGSVFVSLILGLGLGFLSGNAGGFFDSAMNRISDMFLVFPVIFLIILILALYGNSLLAVIIVLGFSGWMTLYKIVRSEVISIKNKDFFISAKMIGLNKKQLLFNEFLPLIIASVIVNVVFQFGNVILAEAALSYLGLGTGSNYPSWGAMIESGQEYLTKAWWMIFSPGVLLIATLLTANYLGRKINRIFNPRVNI